MVTATRPLPEQEQATAPRSWLHLALRPRQIGIALIGLLAAAGVGYTTSKNPAAAPMHAAALLRVLVILALIAAGIYAQTSKLHEKMGRLLILAGLFSAVWLLNGSGNRVLFTVGALAAGLAQAVFAYLLLAQPVGDLRFRAERRFFLAASVPMAILWILGFELTGQPPLKTPLLQCVPHCPRNPVAFGHASALTDALQVLVAISWLALVLGAAFLLFARMRSAAPLARQGLFPVWATATINALLTAIYLVLIGAGSRAAKTVGAIDIALGVVVPLAVLLGLALERSSAGQALAEFVSELSLSSEADPQVLMARALQDPSLTIAYPRPGQGTYVDAAGRTVVDPDRGRATTQIERDGRPVAAVTYDPELSDQRRFVEAAGAAAVMRLEKTQVEADLRASTAELAASRMRLMEVAEDERRRLERDLHDGVQQHLVALRIKLDLAAEEIADDADRARAALARMGQEMDDVLAELRALARGIYPSLLHDHGLEEALRAAARGTPTPAMFRARGLHRYAEETEVAVYYCCVEALQNVTKHAGPGAEARITLWEDATMLHFEISDNGSGFDPEQVPLGAGLLNMRDRIETVGGTLKVTSRRGAGTVARGSAPID